MILRMSKMEEEWNSGLRRVNGILRNYGTNPVVVEDAGIAVRMNVRRNTVTSDGTEREKAVTAKSSGVTVIDTVNDDRNRWLSLIKAHPGMRAGHYA